MCSPYSNEEVIFLNFINISQFYKNNFDFKR
jgi:hypothetical protein